MLQNGILIHIPGPSADIWSRLSPKYEAGVAKIDHEVRYNPVSSWQTLNRFL
jgi:hypothetical protein